MICTKFVITQDEKVASFLMQSGYKPLPNTGSGFFIFENIPQLSKFCFEKLQQGSYVFTNKLFF